MCCILEPEPNGRTQDAERSLLSGLYVYLNWILLLINGWKTHLWSTKENQQQCRLHYTIMVSGRCLFLFFLWTMMSVMFGKKKGSMAESCKSKMTWDRLVSLKDLGFTACVRVKRPNPTFIYDCFGFGLTKRILKYFLISHHPMCTVIATSHSLWFLVPGPKCPAAAGHSQDH